MRRSFNLGRTLGAVLCVSQLALGCAGSDAGEDDAEVTISPLGAFRRHDPTPHWARVPMRAAAARLCDLQADRTADNAHNGLDDTDPDDGGWDWLLTPTLTGHSTGMSPENLYGATALGLWSAREVPGDRARYWTAELDAAAGALDRAEVDSPPDFVHWVLLGERSHRSVYARLARERYELRRTAVGSARAYAESIRDSRHRGNNDGLIAYDLAWLALAATALDAAFPRAGFDDDAKAIAQVVIDDLAGTPGYFDETDANERYYVQGLAWSLVALNQAARPPRSVRSELRTRLLELQTADGAWGWNGVYTAPDLQSTAHAVQALSLTQHRSSAAARRAARWLVTQQQPSGGFLYTATQESPLLDADVLLAWRLVTDPDSADTLSDGDSVRAVRAALSVTSDAAPAPLASPF